MFLQLVHRKSSWCVRYAWRVSWWHFHVNHSLCAVIVSFWEKWRFCSVASKSQAELTDFTYQQLCCCVRRAGIVGGEKRWCSSKLVSYNCCRNCCSFERLAHVLQSMATFSRLVAVALLPAPVPFLPALQTCQNPLKSGHHRTFTLLYCRSQASSGFPDDGIREGMSGFVKLSQLSWQRTRCCVKWHWNWVSCIF